MRETIRQAASLLDKGIIVMGQPAYRKALLLCLVAAAEATKVSERKWKAAADEALAAFKPIRKSVNRKCFFSLMSSTPPRDGLAMASASGRVAAGHPQALFLRAPLHRRERAGFGATPRVVEDALAVVERAPPTVGVLRKVDWLTIHGVNIGWYYGSASSAPHGLAI